MDETITLAPDNPVDQSDVVNVYSYILKGDDLDHALREKVGALFLDHVMIPTIKKMVDNNVDPSEILEILVREFNLGIKVRISDSLGSRKALSGSPKESRVELSTLFSQFEEIRDTSSRLEKEEVIEDIMTGPSAEVFRTICRFVYDPFRRLGARVSSTMLDDVDSTDEPLSDIVTWKLFQQLLDWIESGRLTGGSAKKAIVDFFSTIDEDYIEWFSMILNKKLKIGIGRATVDKFVPDIPRFSVQLCKKYKGGMLLRPYMVQPKVDGLRAVVGRFEGSRVALSRNGKPLYNVDDLIEACGDMCELLGEEYVLDGEFYAGSWADSVSITKRSKRCHNSSTSLKFYVFDAIPLKEWVQQRCETNLLERDTILQVAIETLANPRIVHLQSIVSDDAEEVVMIASAYSEDGWEGAVLKDPSSYYSYDRDDSWLKFKFVEEVDVEIVGVKYGWHDSIAGGIIDEDDPRATNIGDEWKPVIRSIIVEHGGVETSVGSGLELSQRYDFYTRSKKGGLIGEIAEVAYQSVTPDGKLLFPRFLRLREDKST